MTYITWSIIFSLFGFVYFGYGRKQKQNIPFWVGIILIVFPYFIHNPYVMIPIGIALIILPFVYKR
ncbi:MAG: hypothetical protein ACJAW3_001310 [Lentimonas sp.]|jgi:hypothetical protein